MQFNNLGVQQNPWGSMNSWGAGFENGSMGNDFSGPLSGGDNPAPTFDFRGSGYGQEGGFDMNMPSLNAAVVPQNSIWDNMIGTPGAPGWGGMALGAVGGLASTGLGLAQYNLAKKSLAQNKEQFQMNFGAQQKMTNSRLEDRQRARVASGSGYQSVGDYMKKYAV